MKFRNIAGNYERAEEILVSWANLTDELLMNEDCDGLLKRLTSRYPEIFSDPVGIELSGNALRWIAGMRTHLRAVWDAPDQRTKDWYIFKLRDLYARAHEKRIAEAFVKIRGTQQIDILPITQTFQRLREAGMILDSPPRNGPFEDLMYYFQKRVRNALHCASDVCPAPYFFKQDGVRTQSYCSTDCAHVARLESKRRSWNKSGKTNRDRRLGKLRKGGR